MIVQVSVSFEPYVDATLLRLRYLYPGARFEIAKGPIEVTADPRDEERIRRDVNYTLYRERILRETMPMRRGLVAGVMGR